MKAIAKLTGIFLFVLMSGCGNKTQTTSEIIKNDVQRKEIMESISKNPEMMTEMMDEIMQNNDAFQMMQNNPVVMRKMMSNHQAMMKLMEKDTAMAGQMMSNMMGLMEKDSAMCNMMCMKMGGNKHMKGMMQGTMMKDNMMMVCPMHSRKKQAM